MANDQGIPTSTFKHSLADYEKNFYNFSNTSKKNQPYILNLQNLERVYFQTIPETIKIAPEASIAVINSPGRNNPFYQYTGGEDTISFSITWYADEANKQDVIRKCKWLESLSRNDAYKKGLPELQFVFGELFRDSKWMMKSASYEIGLFDRESGFLPKLATQEITLYRISSINSQRNSILKINT